MCSTVSAMAATVIDWSAAVRSGQRLAPTGPEVTAAQARQVVADLRTFSGEAELIVRDTTHLGIGLPVVEAEVVDRLRWIEATAQGMALLTEPLAEKLAARLAAAPRAKSLAGSQLGVVLSFLSGRVLGQYDPLVPNGNQNNAGTASNGNQNNAGTASNGTAGAHDPAEPGRLLLVAPNIIKVEREISAIPKDFRMWVCLHESTHRLQFTAVPWLRDHFRSLVADFAQESDTDPGELLRRAARAIGGRGGDSSWIETIQTPAQRVLFDQLMALMTLLEGHADHVMDAVGPSVVPSVVNIRAGFSERRRRGRGPADRLLRALLGMDMKIAQYVKGAAFVSAVVGQVGMDAFNRVWTSPQTLPTREETTDPKAWMARVLG